MEPEYYCEDPEVFTGMTKPENLALVDMFKLDFVDLYMMSNEHPIRLLYDKHYERVARRRMFQFSADAAAAEHLARSRRRFEAMRASGLLRALSKKEIPRVMAKSLPPL